jgi:uncharacterized surface protein with fasciclin (FAS1) repeats
MNKRFLVAVLLLLLGLLPLKAQGDIIDTLLQDPDFSTFTQALTKADASLLDALIRADNLTVLAPTNQAFERLSKYLGISLEDLTGNSRLVTALLSYHVINGRYSEVNLRNNVGGLLPTLLSGAFVQVGERANGTIVFNNVGDVLKSNIRAGNSIIHAVDDGLLNRVIEAVIAEERPNFGLNAPEVTLTPAATTPDPEASGETQAGVANVRFAHFLPSAPELIVLDGVQVLIPSLTYGEVSRFVTLQPGSFSFTFSNTTPSNIFTTVGDVPLEEDAFLMVVLREDENGAIVKELLTLEFPPLEQGQTFVRVYHADRDASSLTFILDDTLIASPLNFGEMQTATLPLGVYQPRVILNDTRQDLLNLGRVSLWQGSYYFFAVIADGEGGARLSATSVSTDTLSQLLSAFSRGR